MLYTFQNQLNNNDFLNTNVNNCMGMDSIAAL